MKSAPPLAFDLHPSRWVAHALALMGVLAVLAPWLSALPGSASAGLGLLTSAYTLRAWRRHRRPTFRRVAWRASGWTLVDASDREHPALLVGHRRLGPLRALDFHIGFGERHRTLLLPDNLDADTRRRLTVLLARGDVVHERAPASLAAAGRLRHSRRRSRSQ